MKISGNFKGYIATAFVVALVALLLLSASMPVLNALNINIIGQGNAAGTTTTINNGQIINQPVKQIPTATLAIYRPTMTIVTATPAPSSSLPSRTIITAQPSLVRAFPGAVSLTPSTSTPTPTAAPIERLPGGTIMVPTGSQWIPAGGIAYRPNFTIVTATPLPPDSSMPSPQPNENRTPSSLHFDSLGYAMSEDGSLTINGVREGGSGSVMFEIVAYDAPPCPATSAGRTSRASATPRTRSYR